MRHLQVKDLWLQDLVRRGRVPLRKVRGTENPADALTKYMSADMIKNLLNDHGLTLSVGHRVDDAALWPRGGVDHYTPN